MIDFYNLTAKAYLNDDGEIRFYRSTDSLDEFLPFQSKDEYLAWRAEWRQAYKELSKDIRERRTAWRAEGQEHDPVLQGHLSNRRRLARLMLALRHESKRRAERLYQASKEASQVA